MQIEIYIALSKLAQQTMSIIVSKKVILELEIIINGLITFRDTQRNESQGF